MTTTPFPRQGRPSRRALLGGALAAGATLPLGLAVRASAATRAPGAPNLPKRPGAPAAPGPNIPTRPKPRTPAGGQLVIPPPTGPHRVGTVDLHLVDTSRQDPLNPGQPYPLMASVWYPARRPDADRHPVAPWTIPAVFQAWLAGVGYPGDALPVPVTSGRVGAPVHRGDGRLPVVVFSHGAHDLRADTTTVVQQLASHGYAVVTVDHTDDAYTEFPGGPVLSPVFRPGIPMSPSDFALDATFVLDCVEQLAAGHNPDVDGKTLPDGLLGSLDLHRVGMFGWSKGGTATALAALADDRIRAGLSFDGPMEPTITTDLAKPFMMMSAVFTRDADPDAQEFWTHLKGWRRYVQLDGAQHLAFTDVESFIVPAAPALGLSQQDIEGYIGTMDPKEGVRIQQAYPLAFFDEHLRHRHSTLLDGPSPEFPSVRFVP